MTDSMIKHIVIVGGGSAGWLTAGLIAAQHQYKHKIQHNTVDNKTHARAVQANTTQGDIGAQGDVRIKVTLVESPHVAIVGVGEGTWPSMRLTLEKMGIKESHFLRACGASFKQGSKFVGWVNGQPNDVYHHPFTEPAGYRDANLHAAWQQKYTQRRFGEAVCVQPRICDDFRGPKQQQTPEYAGVLNYAYHLDAGKFCRMLQDHCTDSLGVTHISDDVTRVISAADGAIKSLATVQSGQINGDLFIDCTGSSALLIDQHFNVPFVSQKNFLFNDSALALQVPYEHDHTAIESATLATAQQSGWIWDIGLYRRRGTGYVFSSAHISDDQAEAQLRAYAKQKTTSSVVDSLNAKKLNIRPGYRKQFWYRNCIAIGQSAGFIEPLEASALVMVELAASMIADELPVSREAMPAVAKTFNRMFEYRWQRIIDFLKLHYVLSQRTCSPYWLDARSENSIPEHLKDLLSIWQTRPPNQNDFSHSTELFPAASYLYILYGMGFETDHYTKQSDKLAYAEKCLSDVDHSLERILSALPKNRDLLQSLNA